MTKLADSRPPFCASCFQQPQGRYVDFEAAYDGPVIGTDFPQPVDDLVICEGCLAEAFSILDPQGLTQTIAELEQVVRDQAQEILDKDKAVKGAEFTISELVKYSNVIGKIPGRPKLIGVQDDVRKIITQRMFERRGTTSAPKNPRRGKRIASQESKAEYVDPAKPLEENAI